MIYPSSESEKLKSDLCYRKKLFFLFVSNYIVKNNFRQK